jgi:hypothetical protein
MIMKIPMKLLMEKELSLRRNKQFMEKRRKKLKKKYNSLLIIRKERKGRSIRLRKYSD